MAKMMARIRSAMKIAWKKGYGRRGGRKKDKKETKLAVGWRNYLKEANVRKLANSANASKETNKKIDERTMQIGEALTQKVWTRPRAGTARDREAN